MLQKKICLLGSFAVGKTSLARRFVHSIFSEKYHTTIGVKIDRKEVALDGQEVKLLIWDIHGDDEFQKVRASYLRGMSGYLLVADGTRPDTIETTVTLHELAADTVGDLPFIMLINKSDLRAEWRVRQEDLTPLEEKRWIIHRTSAKSGEQVDESFHQLAALMLAKDQDQADN